MPRDESVLLGTEEQQNVVCVSELEKLGSWAAGLLNVKSKVNKQLFTHHFSYIYYLMTFENLVKFSKDFLITMKY